MKHNRFPIVGLWLRSFLVQAAWNSERYLNLGLTMMMAPVVARWRGRDVKGICALKKYLEVFNTHPYFISFLVGAFSRWEAADDSEETNAVEVAAKRKRLMGLLAAVGGALYWEGVRPLWGLIGILWVYLAEPLEIKIWGAMIMVVGYNLCHFHIRWRGLMIGWRDGERGIKEYLRRFRQTIGELHRVGLLLLGGLLVFLPDALLGQGFLEDTLAVNYYFGLGVCLLLFVLFLTALTKQFGVTRITLLLTVVGVFITWLAEVIL